MTMMVAPSPSLSTDLSYRQYLAFRVLPTPSKAWHHCKNDLFNSRKPDLPNRATATSYAALLLQDPFPRNFDSEITQDFGKNI